MCLFIFCERRVSEQRHSLSKRSERIKTAINASVVAVVLVRQHSSD